MKDKSLKYFRYGSVQCGYGEKRGIVLGRVFSISREGQGFVFYDECDGYFFESLPKSDTIAALTEALDWVKEQ